MENEQLEKLRYPIGKYQVPDTITEEHLQTWISVLEELPKRLEKAVAQIFGGTIGNPIPPWWLDSKTADSPYLR